MLRFIANLVVLFFSACGPDTLTSEVGAAPLLPFVTSPPSTPTTPSADDAGVTEADAGRPPSNPAPPLLSAKFVWESQDKVDVSAGFFERSHVANAVSWLRTAKNAAGSQVTTGTVTILADDSVRYTPGGSTLKVSKPGFSGELRIHSLVGDVSGSIFPNGEGQSIDVSWLWGDGTSARCTVSKDSGRFVGVFRDEHDELVRVDSTRTGSIDSLRWQDASGNYASSASGTFTYRGTHTFDDRVVTFDSTRFYGSCIGTPCTTPSGDNFIQHLVTVTQGSRRWRLDYVTGFVLSTPWSITRERWSGIITGDVSGRLEARPVGSSFALEVVVGNDRHFVRSAIDLAP